MMEVLNISFDMGRFLPYQDWRGGERPFASVDER